MINWTKIFPEINLIKDAALINSVLETCNEAISISGMDENQLMHMPFTLKIPNTPVTYIEHVQIVLKMVVSVTNDFVECYDITRYSLNKDYLIAGAILHDVGKILEYKVVNGKYVTSEIGKDLRHPFSGTGLAMKHNIPYDVCHIIATHAGEGNGNYRSPEAVLVNRIDDMNFVMLKAFQGMI